jgi:cytolysin-activating lysine-acyltransferase
MESKTKHHTIEESFIAVYDMQPSEALWDIVKICHDSDANLNWTLADVCRIFVPPTLMGSYRIFYHRNELESIPVAFCTWAWLDQESDNSIRINFIDPLPTAWDSGENLWIIDLVSTTGHTKKIAKYLRECVFRGAPGGWAWALRRDNTSKVRKIAKWPLLKI